MSQWESCVVKWHLSFQYRIDGWSGGLNNGGIWEAAKVYSFISTSPSQTNVNLVKKYGSWTSAEDIGLAHSISNRMPWLGTTPKLLTTFSATPSSPWWGTLIQRTADGFGVGAWVLANPFLTELRYWMREMTSGKIELLLYSFFFCNVPDIECKKCAF